MSNIHDGQVKYHEIINYFCDKFKYSSYLELGLRNAEDTFNKVRCNYKTSVDINPSCRPTYCMTTDVFFNTLDESVKYDLIFIDACHEKSFVQRDFDNAMKHLNENGTIVMDDINPTQEFLLGQEWCGTAWEVFFDLGKRSDLQIGTVIPSFTGFVRRGTQIPHTLVIEPTFAFLDANRSIITRPVLFEELDNIVK
jgi:hypothetical protein